MLSLAIALLLQAPTQDLVERALAEEDKEKRQAIVAQLRKLDFASVERAVRTRTYGPPKVPRGEVVERSSKNDLDGEAFKYGLCVPKSYEPGRAWPLLITLNPTVMWPECDAAREKFIVLAPGTTRHTYSSLPGHSFVLTSMREVMSELNVDPDRIYLEGEFMGGGGTFDLAEKRPDLWAAIAPLRNIPDVRQKKDGTMVPMLCENFFNIPVRYSVYAEDPKVPVEWARVARDAMKTLKVDLTYEEVPGSEYLLSPGRNAEMVAWLQKHTRRTYPEEVLWKTYEKGFPRAYWVEALKRTDANPILTYHLDQEHKESDCRAEFRPAVLIRAKRSGNVIDVRCEEVKELRIWLDDAMVDLDKPVTITVNGKKRHDAKVLRSVDVLIDEARRRRDRAMTFAAYVDIKN